MRIRSQTSQRIGLTQIEVIIATLLMSLVMVAALQASAMKMRHAAIYNEQAVGSLLANDLMTEVMRRAYSDKDTPQTFGRDQDELTAYKSSFDDVDDYNDWSESPPRHENGDYYTYGAGWTRSVNIAYVLPEDPAQASMSDTGVKRVQISVMRNSRMVAELTAIAAEAGQ